MIEPPLGQRERNKLDKRQRIRDAAGALFTEHGFDATTMRAIAQQAGVGLGTLFEYADDKRDLIFLLLNDDLAHIAQAHGLPHDQGPLSAQAVQLFRPYYECFAAQPVLARLLLRELTFYAAGKQADAFLALRGALMERLVGLVTRGQQAGRLRPDEDPRRMAQALFFVYAGAVRLWIAGERPDAEAGLEELHRLLTLQQEGLQALSRPTAPAPAPRR